MNGIQIMTEHGWRTMDGTGVSKVTPETLPEHVKCPPTTFTGIYQNPDSAGSKYGYMYDFWRDTPARNRAFNVEQARLLNSIAA
jgi:hypothetical protein